MANIYLRYLYQCNLNWSIGVAVLVLILYIVIEKAFNSDAAFKFSLHRCR